MLLRNKISKFGIELNEPELFTRLRHKIIYDKRNFDNQ